MVFRPTAIACLLASCLGGCFTTRPSNGLVAPSTSQSSTGLGHDGGSCETAPFDPALIQSKAASSTVLITAGQGTGSGFVIREGREQLIVTNFHVVAAGTPHAARLTLADGRSQSVPVEVVLVSRDDDLALLRPSADLASPPLTLSSAPPRTGEGVAALGYPGVLGSELNLTLEPGTVTAPRRELDGSAYIQTNANINPGNSGGPLVDRCGRVLGVVNGKHRTTERVGLAVPVAALTRLLDRYRAPRPTREVAIEQQLQSFLTEVRFRRNDRAARFFGRAYVEKTATSELVRVAKTVNEKVEAVQRDLKKRGARAAKLTTEAVTQELARRLTPLEGRVLQLAVSMQQNKVSMTDAAHQFLSWSAADQFGEIDDIWVEGVRSTKAGCVDAYVTAVTSAAPNGARRFVVHLHEEYGEWLVQSVNVAR